MLLICTHSTIIIIIHAQGYNKLPPQEGEAGPNNDPDNSLGSSGSGSGGGNKKFFSHAPKPYQPGRVELTTINTTVPGTVGSAPIGRSDYGSSSHNKDDDDEVETVEFSRV